MRPSRRWIKPGRDYLDPVRYPPLPGAKEAMTPELENKSEEPAESAEEGRVLERKRDRDDRRGHDDRDGRRGARSPHVGSADGLSDP